MTHYLFGDEGLIDAFEQYDRDKIKAAIIKHLHEHPEDLVEHCKDYEDHRKYLGYETINVYQINPLNERASLIITKGDKEFFKSIEDEQ